MNHRQHRSKRGQFLTGQDNRLLLIELVGRVFACSLGLLPLLQLPPVFSSLLILFQFIIHFTLAHILLNYLLNFTWAISLERSNGS